MDSTEVAHFEDRWRYSLVENKYLHLVDKCLDDLVEEVSHYDPRWDKLDEQTYLANVEMMAFTTTELLAQLCAGGHTWIADKARFLSPTVDFMAIVRWRAARMNKFLGPFSFAVSAGSWDFMQVAANTQSWFEALRFPKRDFAYLLWCAHKVLRLLKTEERIPGFTELALKDNHILDGFRMCESPIESVLYMQLVIDNLRPPVLQPQWNVGNYRLDFAIPDALVDIECDGRGYHDLESDKARDKVLNEMGWTVLRFSADNILNNSLGCAQKLRDIYPWDHDLNPSSNITTSRYGDFKG